MHESSLQSRVLRYLNSLPNCVAENVSGNSSQSGRSDINGCIDGRAFHIELKVMDYGNTPTKKQLFELLRWQKAGALVMVAYTLRDIEWCFSKFGYRHTSYKKRYSDEMLTFYIVEKDDTIIRKLLRRYDSGEH